MLEILKRIYETGTLTDGVATYSALSPRTGRLSHIDPEEGALLQRVIDSVCPTTTLEVGLAYGVSTLFICEALSRLSHPARHLVIDPDQHSEWHGVGLANVERAGFAPLIEFFEEPSEYCLPRLAEHCTEVQVAFIDGIHTFHQCSLEFYYIDRMLPPGGVVVFDDVLWPAINRVVRMVLSRGNYTVRDRTGPRLGRGTVLGRARRALGTIPPLARVLRPDFISKDWDLGISGTCVALEKLGNVAADTHGRDFRDF